MALGWSGKQAKRALKRRAKFLPKSIAEREALRAKEAKRKREQRELNRGEIRERIKLESATCADLEWIKRFAVEVEGRPGCWIWKGPWKESFGRVRPFVKRHSYGFMYADRAVWLALGLPGLVKRNYLRTTCEHDDCVAPAHLYVTNQTLERARKNMVREDGLEPPTCGS